ncbi:holin family protein [Salibaculum sp.]|uniref:holin family protein n=1 Tax=Salibaculum sp. TaxID=2855480 RepID=UPI002B49691B|nr:holin family protein [Salibaculum sp.]HKL69279.1 holin family protein [Salibaculum sp.]
MGLIERVFSLFFDDGRNIIRETAEVFRENTEAAADRETRLRRDTLRQLAQEFEHPRPGRFDRFMNGLNRLPRPLLAFGTIGLFVVAMVDPLWFASRMQGIAVVPEPLWWLMGAIVSFYFGARHQAHSQRFQSSIAQTLSRVPAVIDNTARLEAMRARAPAGPEDVDAASVIDAAPNPALAEWQGGRPR